MNKGIHTVSIASNSRLKFNELWTRILNLPKGTDVFAKLSVTDLIVLKECISNINGLITQEVSLRFIDWLGDHHILTSMEMQREKQKLANVSAFANGYDIDIAATDTHSGIVAEVKCNLPVSPNKFGAMQKKGIIKDLVCMSNPSYKKGMDQIDLQNTYRFLVLLDYQSQVKDIKKAMDDLLNYIATHESISISHITYKLLGSNQSDIIHVEIYHPGVELNTNTIYIVFISLTNN